VTDRATIERRSSDDDANGDDVGGLHGTFDAIRASVVVSSFRPSTFDVRRSTFDAFGWVGYESSPYADANEDERRRRCERERARPFLTMRSSKGFLSVERTSNAERRRRERELDDVDDDER